MKNIYLIKANSYNLLNDTLSSIIPENATITSFSLNDTTIFDVIDDARYYGLLGGIRALLIKDVKFFGGKFNYESEATALRELFDSNDESMTLIFVCDDIKKTKELTKKAIAAGAKIIDIKDPDKEELGNLISEFAKKENLTIDKDASNLLISNAIGNYDVIVQEINKLSLVDKHITKNLVLEYGSHEDGDYTFDFSNAVVSKDFTKAFSLLDTLLEDGVEVFSLVGLLASSFANMYMVKRASMDGLSDEAIAKLFGYSSTSRVYVLKKNSKIYSIEDLKEIIIALSDVDYKIKTGYNPIFEFKTFLLNL